MKLPYPPNPSSKEERRATLLDRLLPDPLAFGCLMVLGCFAAGIVLICWLLLRFL